MNVKFAVVCLLVAIILPPSVGVSQQPINWEPTLESAQRQAAQSNRLVLIQFWAQWCGVCKRMEAETFTQPGIITVLSEKYVPVKVNADHFPAMARRYGITALPTTVITTADGQLVDLIRGRLETAQYLDRIGRVAAEVEKRQVAKAAIASQNNTSPPAYTPANSAPTAGGPQYEPNQPGQVASAVPPSQPVPTTSGSMNAPSGGYSPPTGYVPPQDGYSPPAQPMTTAQPSPAYPPENAVPTPRYDNPSATHGQAPYQAPVAPAYGSRSPAQPIPSQPPVNPNPPTTYGQPPVDPNLPAANVVAQPSAPVSQPKMDTNPPLCIDGFCPVTLCEKQSWVQGNVSWGGIHRGRTYLFAGPEEQRRFFTDPDRYAPVGSGNDVVLAAEQGRAVPGMREHGVFFGSRIYLFASEESLTRFAEKPEVYANQVMNATRSGSNGRQLQ